MSVSQNSKISWKNAPTRSIKGGDVTFAYRELGTDNPGVPVVCLIHLAAVLDNWDPRVIDGLATKHHVVTFDNRGIGASSGSPASSMEQMARDAITFIKAMGFEQVDLFGFSMGGMIAQEIVLMEPQLVRKMIITGTGPAGGVGISKVARVTYLDMLRGWLTFQDPKQFLFFTRTPERHPRGQRISGSIEGALREPGQGNHRRRAAGAVEGVAQLGLKATRGPFKGPSPRACRQRRQRPHGAKQQYPRFGAASAE